MSENWIIHVEGEWKEIKIQDGKEAHQSLLLNILRFQNKDRENKSLTSFRSISKERLRQFLIVKESWKTFSDLRFQTEEKS